MQNKEYAAEFSTRSITNYGIYYHIIQQNKRTSSEQTSPQNQIKYKNEFSIENNNCRNFQSLNYYWEISPLSFTHVANLKVNETIRDEITEM